MWWQKHTHMKHVSGLSVLFWGCVIFERYRAHGQQPPTQFIDAEATSRWTSMHWWLYHDLHFVLVLWLPAAPGATGCEFQWGRGWHQDLSLEERVHSIETCLCPNFWFVCVSCESLLNLRQHTALKGWLLWCCWSLLVTLTRSSPRRCSGKNQPIELFGVWFGCWTPP